MVTADALAEMSEEQILDFAGGCAERIRDAETDLLQLAYQWAVVHPGIALDPAEAHKPGRERARQWGGDGTPDVSEFAAAEFGARIGRSPAAAASLIGDALDLQHRLPQLWARVQAGEVRASYARFVATRSRELTLEQVAHVDAGVVEPADGRIPWSRFEVLVAAKVAQAAPDLAREKEERAAKARFAKKVRTGIDDAHGMGSFLVRADIATIEAIDHAVTVRARRVAETQPDAPHLATDDERRVHAFLLLVSGRPDETDLVDLLPGVQLFVHSYAGPDREDIVRVEGHGPLTGTWLRDVLGPHARFTVRPVLDLCGQAPVDAYEIPERHRQAVHLMTPADTFPFASCTSRTMEIDHTTPHAQGGISGIGNYGPMSKRHHRIKTFGRWHVQQPFPGIFVWRDPHGAFYLVDHTGTRRVPGKPTSAQAPPPHRSVIAVEFSHPTFDVEIDDDYPSVA